MRLHTIRLHRSIPHGLLAFLVGFSMLFSALLRATPASAAAGTNTLFANETLNSGQSLVSDGGQYQAVMQGDGNLVIYTNGQALWSSNTAGNSGTRLVMQGDGNLVIYNSSNVAVFVTGTVGITGARLVMQTDGNLVLYASDGRAWWASKSSSERAIQWFYNRQGWTSYEGKCELAVENAFGTSGQYLTAKANWNARTKYYPYSSAPRGTLVFYNTSVNGHVGISLGNGQVISTSAGGKIGIVPISYFQNPLGWAYSPW